MSTKIRFKLRKSIRAVLLYQLVQEWLQSTSFDMMHPGKFVTHTHVYIYIYIRMYAVCWYLFIHISYLNMYTDLFSLQMESCHWNKESKVGRLRMFFCATGMKVNTAMHYACIKIGSDVNHFNRTPWYPYYTWGFPDRTADGAGPGTICLLDVGGQNRTTDRSRSLSLRESLENVLNIHSTVLRM